MDRDDKRRYFIVGSVILEVVTPLFRTRLERVFTSKGLPSLQAFINTQPVIHILFHLRHKHKQCCVDGPNCYNHQSLPLTYCQWKQLYSEKPGNVLHNCHCKFTANPVQLEDIDITLSSLILLNCCILTPADVAAVRGLRQYKNDFLSHNTTGRISQTDYNSLWTDMKSFVLQLDPCKQDEMVRIERRPLDEALGNSYVINLLDIHKKLDELDNSFQGIRSEGQNACMQLDNSIQGVRSEGQNAFMQLDNSIQGVRSEGQNAFMQLDNSIQGLRSDIQGQNACMQEILHYIRKDGGSCPYENSKKLNKDHTDNKPYILGQDVFKFNHQINLTSEIPNGIEGKVSDIVIMDDGRVVICLPNQKRLLICNTDGSNVDSIPVHGRPWRVTAVNNYTVAVTLKWNKCIYMFDINKKLKSKSISMPRILPWLANAITTINNELVVSGCSSLLVIDHQTCKLSEKINNACIPERLHCSGDKMIYFDMLFKVLYMYSYTEDRHCTLTLQSRPSMVTTLQDGSLYLVCKDGSVQHVSSDAKQYTTVKTKGLHKLNRLAYNPKQKQLITKTKKQRIFNVFYEK